MATFTPEQLVELTEEQLNHLTPEQLEQRDALIRQRRLLAQTEMQIQTMRPELDE